MIVAKGLSKSYSGFSAISGVDFEIQDGEIIGLLGLNGAGKSTILKILGCFLMPSSGTAIVGGHRVDQNPHEIRKMIGFLPDSPPLYDEMEVEAYLRYVARLKEVPKSQIQAAVDRVVEKTELRDVLGARLGELSHGYRQRVSISQALVHNPKVLILDEPINGLDPVQIVEMRDLIKSLGGHHTIVLSSHILSEITQTCDRILIIDQGKLVYVGDQKGLEMASKNKSYIEVEWRNAKDACLENLKALATVSKIDHETGDEVISAKVYAEADVRPDVAKAIIQNGGDLLSMKKAQGDLENVFMQLVKNSHRS